MTLTSNPSPTLGEGTSYLVIASKRLDRAGGRGKDLSSLPLVAFKMS